MSLMKHLHIKNGWYYYVKTMAGKVKWLALSTQDEQEALRKWAEFEGDESKFLSALNGSGSVITLSRLQVEFRHHYLSNLQPNTIRSYDRALQTILEKLGNVPIEQIDRKSLVNIRNSMFSTPYEGNLTLRVASVMLQFALDKGYLTSNPAFFLKKNKEYRISLRLNVDTLFNKILPAAEKDMQTAIILAWQLVQHENEIRHLKWSDFDFSKCTCSFIRKKTKKAITITISKSVAEYLSKLPRNYAYVISPDGNPYPERSFREMWYDALKKAGLEGYMFKEIRHLGNSYLNAQGVQVKDRMLMTGHTSIAINERYTHELGQGTAVASDVLGDAIKYH